MKRLQEIILGKNRWNELEIHIELIEKNKQINPSVALDSAKTLVECVSKTILKDKGIGFENDNLEGLIKKAFASLPVFASLDSKNINLSKGILSSFGSIIKNIGEFRNMYGVFSHGQDLESEKFDSYLLDLVISSSDTLCSFLIISHNEDLKNRRRIYYEENDEFNRYVDDTAETSPEVKGITLNPSKALYSDIEAYKDTCFEFNNTKEDLVQKLEKSNTFASTRAVCSEIILLQDYLTEDEIRRIARAAFDNHKIYQILGGTIKTLFIWILEEKSNYLSPKELDNLNTAFTKKYIK